MARKFGVATRPSVGLPTSSRVLRDRWTSVRSGGASHFLLPSCRVPGVRRHSDVLMLPLAIRTLQFSAAAGTCFIYDAASSLHQMIATTAGSRPDCIPRFLRASTHDGVTWDGTGDQRMSAIVSARQLSLSVVALGLVGVQQIWEAYAARDVDQLLRQAEVVLAS